MSVNAVFCFIVCGLVGPAAAPGTPADQPAAGRPDWNGRDVISLAGVWQFALDPENAGVDQQWFAKDLADTVRLPGTTDENHKGVRIDEQRVDRLSRVWYWKGPAWYRRWVRIPESWRGKRVTLFLERTKHTRVWVDRTFCGWDDTLSAPHVFDVTAATPPGQHAVTILVDNSRLPPVGPSHAVDERTQTNWNGVIGRIELAASDPVWLDDVQVYPDVETRRAVVRAAIGNITGRPAAGRITVDAESWNTPEPARFPPQAFPLEVPRQGGTVELAYSFPSDAPLWDEFHPALLRLRIRLQAHGDGRTHCDDRIVTFGMRRFATRRGQFTINGRPVFLRGKLDCCFFPQTGYPPMNKAGWRRVFSIAKSYGVNHYRFHSWCPPEAAFQAADELGVYVQAELPNKRSGFDPPEPAGAQPGKIDRRDLRAADRTPSLYEYARREGELIFKAYGNHPSLVMFTLGNELGRSRAMFDLVAYYKQIDPRRLYAQGSNNVHWNPHLAEGDDFWVTAKTDKTLPVRGSFFEGDYPQGHIEHAPPSTMVDYSRSIRGVPVPVVSHEMGQFQVFPDFREIPKYTGVTRARNLEIFRQRLRAAGMLDQAEAFVRASGALSVICYREDIEAALRTPGLGGFQLLDLQDFPGQGTALVGVLNVFLESKGLIAPEAWRRFCCETVPLLRMKKYTWTTDETFVGRVQVAHYGASELREARVAWTARDQRGRRLAGGEFAPLSLPPGDVAEVDMFALPLDGVPAPGKLTLSLAIEGTAYRNDYPIWVYPPRVDTSPPPGVLVSERFTDEATQSHLRAGGKVVLLPKLDRLPQSVPGAFQTDFWCYPMFRRAAERRGIEPPPGTLGVLCDPRSPALARFPTESHSNWQWWRLAKNARPVILDQTPPAYRPIVQVIDNFERNHKLGLVFETRVGRGALLVCAIDLAGLQDHPEARQLLHSLLRYAGSPAFDPQAELDAALLKKLLP